MSHVQPTFDELLSFITTATSKGWIGSGSGAAIQSTLRRLKHVLEPDEVANVNAINIEALIRRFSNLNRDVAGGSLQSYASRTKSAIKMFTEWRNDPKTWKPRSAPSNASVAKKSPSESKSNAGETGGTPRQENNGLQDDIAGGRLSYPFPLREGVVVKFVGLPPDLTQNDVERIARFLRVLCVE